MAICGIAVTDNGQPIEAGDLSPMISAQVLSRGESGQEHSLSGASFGASSGLGTGCVHSAGTILVACDADLYNRRELQGEGESATKAGTVAELIALLYLKYGHAFVQRLRGAFAVAVWDGRSRTLCLARDRFGVKPLCYSQRDSALVFASHPRGIFASRRVEKKTNLRALVHYLNYNVIPAPETAFETVTKVRPGEQVLWQGKEARRVKYWDLNYSEDAHRPVEELAPELLARIEDAVRTAAEGVDPQRAGCFLSGGTDSSTVVGLLSRVSGGPVSAFSIGFAENRFNELEYARIAARHFAAQHYESIVSAADASQVIEKIVDGYDEPFANASSIPAYYCAKLAKDHGIEVMLAGDGGDELFGGNERYRTHQVFELYQKIPWSLRKAMERVVFAGPPGLKVMGKAQRYIRRSNTPNPERYCQWRLLQVFPPSQVLGPAMPSLNGDVLAPMRRYYEAAPAQSELNRLLYIDIKMTLGDEDLPKVVRTAELAGLKVRFPYLDHPLAEFSASLPASLKVRGLEKRYLFKRATRNLLPKAILNKKKHGFGLPIGVWLKTDPGLRAFSRAVLLDPQSYQRGYFQRQFVERLMAELEQDNTPYFGDLLWVFLMLELWHRKHVAGRTL